MRNSILLWAKNYSISRLVLLGCLTWMMASCQGNDPKPVETKTTFVVSDTMLSHIELSKASLQMVKGQLKLTGKIVADDNKLVEVFPLVGGYVTTVNIQLGDYVQKGQILASIRSSEVADFERQLIDAQSDVLMAQKNLKVSEDLFSSKLASERDVLSARKEVEKANAELARIREVFQIYGITKKSEYEVRAPISGFITEKKINRDMQLRSDKSDNIFTIAEISDVWVNANVYETDISRIHEDMVAEVRTLSYPDTVFMGIINKVYSMLDPLSKTMKVRVKLHNAGYLLKPEMNATVTLKYDENIQRIAIPSSAVIFDKSKNYVMVFHDRYNIETREIFLEKQAGETTYLIRGVKAGEQVISKDQLLIYDALND